MTGSVCVLQGGVCCDKWCDTAKSLFGWFISGAFGGEKLPVLKIKVKNGVTD